MNKESKPNMIIIHTNKGDIKVNLFNEQAPITCENFLTYVRNHFYDQTIFHRVIKKFMIQGGGLTKDLEAKETLDPIKNEANNGLKNKKYTLAMARKADPHSASAQFFINTVDNSYLDFTAETDEGWGYCVFGEVVDGKDVVDLIEKTPTTTKFFYRDVPREDIIIESVEEV